MFVLQKCFQIRLVKPFFSNLRKEISKMPKVFFSDTGMRNVALNRFFDFNIREDKGQLLENYVYRRLADKYEPENIRYWRTIDKKEIDFVVALSPGTGYAYEVETICRPIKPTLRRRFSQSYPGISLTIVSRNIDDNCQWILKL